MEFDSYLSKLPEYDFAITYGSGVFRQVGYSAKDHKNAMLDVIIGVNDPISWHRTNVQLNPKHYSFVRHFGAKQISNIEDLGYGHVYYNRCIMGPQGQERPVKYGIISLSELERDLTEWNSLYVSGRLQKPVRILRANSAIIDKMNINLKHAVNTVLPLLPLQFTDRQLFLAITGLSYNGDIRTWFAENPNKVQNIVDGNFDNFKSLYKSIIASCPFIHKVEGKEGEYIQDISTQTIARITASLPASLHPYIRKYLEFPSSSRNVTNVTEGAMYDIYYNRLCSLFDPEQLNHNVIQAKHLIAKGINEGVRHAVFRSSIDQAIRGNASFGVWNSMKYVTKKIMKFLK